MKILFCASECVPFIKTGGLADVVGSLPASLCATGQDVRVMLPKYRAIASSWRERMQHVCSFTLLFGWQTMFCGIETLEHDGVTYYFIDNEEMFSAEPIYGDGANEGRRFAFFCRAVLEALPQLGFFPDVLHLNDWQTGLIAALLRTQYRTRAQFSAIKTVFSVHNLRYQGLFDFSFLNGYLGLEERYFTPEFLEFYGSMSCMKAGLVFADHISTVSRTYAAEIKTPYYGEQLDGLLRARGDSVTGILNGIDTVAYDPATDPFLAAHYDAVDMAGKAQCRRALETELGLPDAPDAPLIALIARLTPQKGLDLIERVLPELVATGASFVFLGSGDKHYQDMLAWAAWRYPAQLAFRSGFDEALAHRIYAGADLFLMPSQFEPCGLSQMIALRYGTLPIVRETGGLRDTVVPYNRFTGEGNGFSFTNYNAHEMLFCTERAASLYRENRAAFMKLRARGMAQGFSWAASAKAYLAMYRALLLPPCSEKKKAADAARPSDTDS